MAARSEIEGNIRNFVLKYVKLASGMERHKRWN
jgi:hypothetical protein